MKVLLYVRNISDDKYKTFAWDDENTLPRYIYGVGCNSYFTSELKRYSSQPASLIKSIHFWSLVQYLSPLLT